MLAIPAVELFGARVRPGRRIVDNSLPAGQVRQVYSCLDGGHRRKKSNPRQAAMRFWRVTGWMACSSDSVTIRVPAARTRTSSCPSYDKRPDSTTSYPPRMPPAGRRRTSNRPSTWVACHIPIPQRRGNRGCLNIGLGAELTRHLPVPVVADGLVAFDDDVPVEPVRRLEVVA